MIRLRVRAPFAAFRNFTAGAYRPTAPFITPSAAYGFLLNLAGIETRFDDGQSPMTLTRPDLPTIELALGAIEWPEVHSIFQQLHNYPVGASGKERAGDCRGNKYNIQPVRREFLSDIDALIYTRNSDSIDSLIRMGLRGAAGGHRYGLPFFGDNSFLIDSIVEDPVGLDAHWLVRTSLSPGTQSGRVARMTVAIDRADMTRTKSVLLTASESRSSEPPDPAWIRVP
jgi:CRISPR-associated protein Cas5/DevS